jgi:hypothetical protein
MTEFLRAYFRNSLAYLDQLQKHGASAAFQQPMPWMKTWLDNWPGLPIAKGAPNPNDKTVPDGGPEIAERISRLEQRIAELEADRTTAD